MSLSDDRRRFAARWQSAVQVARAKGATFRIGSGTRSIAEQASLGSPRSQHLIGLAQDFPVQLGSRSARILSSALRAAGLVVIDQPHGTGPHVHAQLYRASEVPGSYFRRGGG